MMGAVTIASHRWFRLSVLLCGLLCTCQTPADDDLACDDDDTAADDDDSAADDDDDAVDCTDPVPAPCDRIWPTAGELYYQQLGFGGFSMGEAALVVGAGGDILLVDAGNDSHDDDIRDALHELISHMNSDGGYVAAPFADGQLEHVLITHLHADHSDGLQDLLADVQVTGRVVHRGFVDLTGATGEGSAQQLCDTLAAHPGLEKALCETASEAPCDPGSWSGTYPATGCPGLEHGNLEQTGCSGRAYLELGEGTRVELFAANGFMAMESYEALEGPLMDDDSNGENARSVGGVAIHGEFRMLFAGDLTGGGSDTDPVEAFYAERLEAATDLDDRGVDVLHAGHHGRDTSSSAVWVDALLPADGLSRNAVMGISEAHVNSPHAEVLETLLDGGRLTEGRGWATTVSLGGATHGDLIDAEGGSIVIATMDGGDTYAVQAIGTDGVVLESRAFHSVRRCR